MSFEIKKNPNKIAVLGTGDGWQLFPQLSDHTVYALNDYVYTDKYQIMPDILFIMDVLDEKPQVVAGQQNLQDVIQRVNKLGIPLVAPFKYDEVPSSIAFPIRECAKEFGLPYFNNTIAYMIAYALLQWVKNPNNELKQIDIYGVNQKSSSEYFYEKAGVEYWLGVANGRGVKITINGDKSELLSNKDRFGGNLLYGYNATYQEIVGNEGRFGESVIKKLLVPPKPFSRTVRRINYES